MTKETMKYNSRVIIACDFTDNKTLKEFLKKFGNEKLFLKLGMQLLYKEGFEILDELKKEGHNIFLDFKLKDIPNTIYQATKSLISHNPDWITIHTMGGYKMMKACIDATKGSDVGVVGVTILTSMDDYDISELNINKSAREQVKDLVMLAKKAGLTHIVSSSQESDFVKQQDMISITPGIRLINDIKEDQVRVLTPQEAFKKGSDFIVVGRTITKSDNPYQTYLKIKEISNERNI